MTLACSSRLGVATLFDGLPWAAAFAGVRLEAPGAPALFGADLLVTLETRFTGALLTRLVATGFDFVRDDGAAGDFGLAEPVRPAGTELFVDLGIVEIRIVDFGRRPMSRTLGARVGRASRQERGSLAAERAD